MASVVFTELLVPLYRASRQRDANALCHRLGSFPNLAVIDLDASIAASATALCAEHGLRTPDAIHAATAIRANTRESLTNDRRFGRLEPDLRVWQFDELV